MTSDLQDVPPGHKPFGDDRPIKIHELKCWPSQWEAVACGRKTFEVRKHDRDFAVGDVLHLNMWDPNERAFLRPTPGSHGDLLSSSDLFAKKVKCEVVYLMPGGQFGIAPDHCVMGIRVISIHENAGGWRAVPR